MTVTPIIATAGVTSHRRPRREALRRLCTAVAVMALGALAGAPAANADTSGPLWQCRASALYVSLFDQNRIEPVLADGNPNTGSGGNPDWQQCSNDEAGLDNLLTPLGIPHKFLAVQTLRAKTGITPEIGKAVDQTVKSVAGIEDLAIKLSPSGRVVLGIGVANSEAIGTCVNGKPVFDGKSKVTDITLGNRHISLDDLLDALSKALKPLDRVVEIKVNEKIKTADGIVVRALHVKVFKSAVKGHKPLIDIVVAESKAGANGPVCEVAKKAEPPKVCPTGSILEPISGLCVIFVGVDRRIVVAGAFEGPRGGRVVTLEEARRLYKSPCLQGPGPQYVVVGTNGRDKITGTNRADRILGLGGNDSLDGGRGNDCLDGGTGNDRATGGIGADRVYGMKGRDTVTGNLGSDRLWGNDGDDHLNGGPGNDMMSAGDGHDTINAGYGRDRALGGAGADYINIATQGPAATAECGDASDKIRLNKKERSRVHGCEVMYVLNDR